MARLLQTGFELGTSASVGADTTATALIAVVPSSPSPRSGTYCLRCLANSITAQVWSMKRIAQAAASEVWYAFGFQHSLVGEPVNAVSFFRVFDAAGTMLLALVCDGGTIRAYYQTGVGNSMTATTGWTLIGSGSVSASSGAWHLIEVRYVPHLTNGLLEVYLDGASILSASAVRTAQSTTPATECALTFTRYGVATGSAASFCAFDDLRVNDTTGSRNNGRPFDEAIRLMVPTGAGDLTQLSRGGTDSGANWSQVEEVPPATADYVTGASAGLTDLYATDDFPTSAISAISLVAQVANSDGAGGTVNLVSKTGAGQSNGSAYALTAVWTYQNRLLETDPSDGAPWNSSKLTSLQLGARIAS